MNTAVMFSSAADEWETPVELFRLLNREFRFEVDLAATPHNAKCARYSTRADDALSQQWRGVCWLNPPYGRSIGRWVSHAWFAMEDGACVVCLLPARTDTRWWHTFVMRATEVRLLPGRLTFGGAKHPAPFPSAVVVFEGRPELARRPLTHDARVRSWDWRAAARRLFVEGAAS